MSIGHAFDQVLVVSFLNRLCVAHHTPLTFLPTFSRMVFSVGTRYDEFSPLYGSLATVSLFVTYLSWSSKIIFLQRPLFVGNPLGGRPYALVLVRLRTIWKKSAHSSPTDSA